MRKGTLLKMVVFLTLFTIGLLVVSCSKQTDKAVGPPEEEVDEFFMQLSEEELDALTVNEGEEQDAALIGKPWWQNYQANYAWLSSSRYVARGCNEIDYGINLTVQSNLWYTRQRQIRNDIGQWIDSGNEISSRYNDFCSGQTRIREYYCDGDSKRYSYRDCPEGMTCDGNTGECSPPPGLFAVGGSALIFQGEPRDEEWEVSQQGENWERLVDAYFSDSNNGWILKDEGNPLRKTDGSAWEEVEVDVEGHTLRSIHFSENHGCIAGDDIVICTENDGGEWEDHTTSIKQQTSIDQNKVLSINTVWRIGEEKILLGGEEIDYQRDSRLGVLIYSDNAGTSWTRKYLQGAGEEDRINDIFFYDSTYGWLVGKNGLVARTTNGGSNWYKKDSRTEHDLNGVHFYDRRNGWAVGNSGVAITSSRGGRSWSVEDTGTGFALLDVYFTDINNGCAVGGGRTIICTEDDGQTWERRTAETQELIYAITPSG